MTPIYAFLARSFVVAVAPVLSALNYTLADTGGGDAITVTGTNLASATACTVGATAATITANTATSLTFTMPAKAAGSYNVQITTAAGPSNTLAIEAWSPAQITGNVVYFDSRKGVAVSGANVSSWTDQKGGNAYSPAATAPTKVANVFGAQPSVRFTATNPLNGTRVATGTNGLTMMWGCKYTATTTANDGQNYKVPITVFGDTSGSVLDSTGMSGGALARAQYSDSPAGGDTLGSGFNDGQPRCLGWTHTSAGVMTAYSGGASVGTVSGRPGPPMTSDCFSSLGGAYGGSQGFTGDLGWAVACNTVISAGDLAKLNAWSQVGFGTL